MPQFKEPKQKTKIMIKEIFDIEPIQKNSLIGFLSICCISFLQLFLFKREIIESNSFLTIGLVLGLSISWVIIQLPSYILFVECTIKKEDDNENLLYDRIALTFGIFLLMWMIILTYIAYEFNLDFKSFIRISIILMIIKSLFWGISLIIKNGRNAKLKKKE